MSMSLYFFIFVNSKLSSAKIKQSFINFHTFLTFDLDVFPDMADFPPDDFFLECVEALHQISGSQVECKWKKAIS